jgi:hypothetical protein
MTFVCVTQAARHLGIDAKTLHRWLASAQLSLHPHPHDGRKHGISEQQLSLLARLHHRRESPLSADAPVVPLPRPTPPLPEALLALPQSLVALQQQIVALQQQVADLTALLRQPGPPPAPQPTTTKRPPAVPTPAVPRARSVGVKAPAKPVHVIARVEYRQDGRYVVISPKQGVLPFEPESQQWFAWVQKQESFRFVGQHGSFTAHHE